MQINIYKIKKGKKNKLINWGKYLSKNRNIAIETLAEENCLEESARIVKLGKDFFLIGAMVAEPGKKLLPSNPNREINKKHFKILEECLDLQIPQEKCYSIQNLPFPNQQNKNLNH